MHNKIWLKAPKCYQMKCGGIFSDSIITNFLAILAVK